MGQGSALHIISEPEAAAMYALDIMDPHNIKVGDTFILCDAGGGTVDLISYTVNSLKPTLSVRESGPGSGTLCGSTFLNRIFQKYIVDKLSALPGWDDDILEEAVKRFDLVVKRQFRGMATMLAPFSPVWLLIALLLELYRLQLTTYRWFIRRIHNSRPRSS